MTNGGDNTARSRNTGSFGKPTYHGGFGALGVSAGFAPVAAAFFASLVLFCLLSLAWAGSALAGPVSPGKFELEQPGGAVFFAVQYGDEWDNGVETLGGYTVVENPSNGGRWEYAVKPQEGGDLKPGGRSAELSAPSGLEKHLRDANADGNAFEQVSEGIMAGTPGAGAAPDGEPRMSLMEHNDGSQKTLVILANFLDVKITTSQEAWAARYFGAENSVQDYYQDMSFGKLNLTAAADTSVTSNGVVEVNLPYYHPDTPHWQDERNQQVAQQAIAQAAEEVNFASYAGGDTKLDVRELHIAVVTAGQEGTYHGVQSKSIPAHTNVFGRYPVTVDGVSPTSYMMIGELQTDHMATHGQASHEMGHQLGFPDTYDTHDADGTSDGLGYWDVMASGSWNKSTGYDGTSPAGLNPFFKSVSDWITPIRVGGTAVTKRIAPAANYAAAFQLRDNPGGTDDWLNGNGSGEYFLVENRYKTGTDAGLPGCGLAVWHIDERIYANTNEAHKLIDLEEADGLRGLDNGDDYYAGDGGDLFPGTSKKTSFSGATNPNSRLYSGVGSGVAIGGISGCGSPMTANYTAPAPPAPAVLKPTITSGPAHGSVTGKRTASFGFGVAGATGYSCSLNGATYTACSSPKLYTGLAAQRHTFYVKAKNSAGVYGSAAIRSWTVQNTVPVKPVITGNPAHGYAGPETTAKFGFTSSGAATYACSLDGAAFTTCTTPKEYTGLSQRTHTFSVKGRNEFGVFGTAATRSWTVTAGVAEPACKVEGEAGKTLRKGTAVGETLAGTAENEKFCGMAGNDTIRPADGDDAVDGGTGVDTLTYSDATAPISVHLDPYAGGNSDAFDIREEGVDLDAHIGYDTPLYGMENLVGSPYADSLTGTVGVNTIYGGYGADTISGGDGNDTIHATDGDVDRIDCGAGVDTVHADANDSLTNCE